MDPGVGERASVTWHRMRVPNDGMIHGSGIWCAMDTDGDMCVAMGVVYAVAIHWVNVVSNNTTSEPRNAAIWRCPQLPGRIVLPHDVLVFFTIVIRHKSLRNNLSLRDGRIAFHDGKERIGGVAVVEADACAMVEIKRHVSWLGEGGLAPRLLSCLGLWVM
jgi:hypothetical protein